MKQQENHDKHYYQVFGRILLFMEKEIGFSLAICYTIKP